MFTQSMLHRAIHLKRYGGRSDFLPYLTFTDKESYLEWIRQWKELYRDISRAIRFFKQEARTIRPRADWYSQEEADRYHKKYARQVAEGHSFDATTETLGALATFLLDLRAAGKVRSVELRRQSHQASAQTAP